MRLDTWIKQAEEKLKNAGIGSANLDALILLEDELGKDRAYILAHPEIELSASQLKKLSSKLSRRLKHEPVAYIRGWTEFYGRKFIVNKKVLEPRPESETMIELLLKLKLPKEPYIADVGTGSGAIGITAKLEIPKAHVHLYEIDKDALAIANGNSRKHKVRLQYYASDLLEPNWGPYDVILANLPYVPKDWKINEAAAMEPRIAIFGGKDGLDLYRRMFDQIRSLSWEPKYILTESLPPQHEKLSQIALNSGFQAIDSVDFIQVFSQLAPETK